MNPSTYQGPEESYFKDIASRIQSKLNEFNVAAEIISVLKGPLVDTFEMQLGPGVKVAKINSLASDLGLALEGRSPRIIYPLQGKTTLGIEVPRLPRDFIHFSELIQLDEFSEQNKLHLPLILGKNTFGKIKLIDLKKMPHMLVAGATGAGKSVFINTAIMSLLLKNSPEKLRLILIDPKQLELALYNDLPHLLSSVITDVDQTVLALQLVCNEMENRYSAMKELSVRNIESFNEKYKTCKQDTKFILKDLGICLNSYDGNDAVALPYLVVVIDEFADLILSKKGKEIENLVCRIAAKSRAAGIHLLIATQRPSVDVITGLIKANFPSRVAFKVASSVDSRTIINSIGAEGLLGNGDMLFKQGVELERVHSSYVSETEIEKFVELMKDSDFQGFARPFNKVLEQAFNDEDEGGSRTTLSQYTFEKNDQDELYMDAVHIVREQGQASASMLQRHLRIGYNRAANIIDVLHEKGVVGPANGARPRDVIDEQQ